MKASKDDFKEFTKKKKKKRKFSKKNHKKSTILKCETNFEQKSTLPYLKRNNLGDKARKTMRGKMKKMIDFPC